VESFRAATAVKEGTCKMWFTKAASSISPETFGRPVPKRHFFFFWKFNDQSSFHFNVTLSFSLSLKCPFLLSY
jgi:hypothetical protein